MFTLRSGLLAYSFIIQTKGFFQFLSGAIHLSSTLSSRQQGGTYILRLHLIVQRATVIQEVFDRYRVVSA